MISLISFISILLSIIISLNYSYILSNFLFEFFPSTEKLISSFFIQKITKGIKYVLDMTLIGIIDDISGAFFVFITTALFISFIINIFQYFDVNILEKEIKESFISFYLFDLAPNTFAYFIDFFPSLEFILENNENKKLTT